MKSTALAMTGIMVLATVCMAGETIKVGEALTSGLEVTSIEAIVADPDTWVGKKVQVAGEVTGVCARQGCWMDLTSPTDTTLRIKVDDGVIVFPPESVGRQAVAEGEVEILDMERDRYEAWLRHVAEEEERDFDPGEVGEAPYRIVRLRGLGSEIQVP
jgi:hypothetical protein